ncbi:hypothetical protein F4779DRAFT_618710 [Xylariaceae sp. FL0662B]|nr:hypothetical protein F4779DRAFT_618710 [Xylariaceae sp. FL0662B]
MALEGYPEEAYEILISHKSPPLLESQLGSVLITNLVLKETMASCNRLPPHGGLRRILGHRTQGEVALYAGEGDELIKAPWAEGAIGTARYVGVSLKKTIKQCGI